MNKRVALWAVLVGLIAAAVGLVAVANHDGGGSAAPRRLPALAIGSATREAGFASTAIAPAADAKGGATYPGRVEYRLAKPLPALPGNAHAVLLTDVDAAPRVAAIANALGVTPADITVDPAPGQPWRYGDGMSMSVSSGCAVASPATDATAPDTKPAEPPQPGATTVPPPASTVPCAPPQRPAGLPTQAEAERIGRDALARTGVDLSGATVRVDDGFSAWFVSVSPEVDGRTAIGWAWTASVGPNGKIESASGYLARPALGDEYPLIGAAAAFDQLKNQPQIEMAIACAPPPNECPVPTPVVRTVTDVRLALMYAPWADGKGAVLVPAYLFILDDASNLPVLALPERYFTPVDPGPVGTKPGQTDPGQPAPDQPESVPPAAPADGSSGSGGSSAVR